MRPVHADACKREHCRDVHVLGKVRHAVASRSLEKRDRTGEAIERYAATLYIRNPLPGGGRLGDLDARLVYARKAGGFQSVEAADAARRHVEQRTRAARRHL